MLEDENPFRTLADDVKSERIRQADIDRALAGTRNKLAQIWQGDFQLFMSSAAPYVAPADIVIVQSSCELELQKNALVGLRFGISIGRKLRELVIIADKPDEAIVKFKGESPTETVDVSGPDFPTKEFARAIAAVFRAVLPETR